MSFYILPLMPHRSGNDHDEKAHVSLAFKMAAMMVIPLENNAKQTTPTCPKGSHFSFHHGPEISVGSKECYMGAGHNTRHPQGRGNRP